MRYSAILVALLSHAGLAATQPAMLIAELEDPRMREEGRYGYNIDISPRWIGVQNGEAPMGAVDPSVQLYRHTNGASITPWQILKRPDFIRDFALTDSMLILATGSYSQVCSQPIPFEYHVVTNYQVTDNVFEEWDWLDYGCSGPNYFCSSIPADCPARSSAISLGGHIESCEPTVFGAPYIASTSRVYYSPDQDLYGHDASLVPATTQITSGVTSLSAYHHNRRILGDTIAQVDLSGLAATEIRLDVLSHIHLETGVEAQYVFNPGLASAGAVGASPDGRWVAVGDPEWLDTSQPGNPTTGAVWIFERTDPDTDSLVLRHQFTAADGFPLVDAEMFGDRIRMDNTAIAVGARNTTRPNATIPGGIYLLELGSDGTWRVPNSTEPIVFTKPVSTPMPNNAYGRPSFASEFEMEGDILVVGVSVADGIIDEDAGTFFEAAGVVQVYALQAGSDCNNNGIADTVDIIGGTEIDIDLNSVPDSCQIAEGAPDCNDNGTIDSFETQTLVDVVVLFDTSGSIEDEGLELCGSTGQLIYTLTDNGFPTRLRIYSINDDGIEIGNPSAGTVSCESNSLTTLYCDVNPDPACADFADCPGNSAGELESWGPGIQIAARNYDWIEGAARIIIPVTDEGPLCGGNGTPDAEDLASAEAAVVEALLNDVRIVPLLGNGSSAGLFALANNVAADTGGIVVDGDVPNIAADLANAVLALIQNASAPAEDCNLNGLLDTQCECLADINSDGVVNDSDYFAWVDAYITGDPIGDQNCDGEVTDSDYFAWLTNIVIFDNGECPIF